MDRALTRQCRFDSGKMVVTVAHGMVLQKELTREGSVAVQRNGRGAIEFFATEGSYCRGCRRTVGLQ
jgi:hypothetical protein